MPRYKPRLKAGPELSHDAHDKLMAALNWYVARNRTDRQYVRGALLLRCRPEVARRLISQQRGDLLDTVIKVATTLSYGGEKVALQYADDLPAVPPWPFQ